MEWSAPNHHSWFLKTDGKGNVWISSAVGADARGDAGHVSVTEVSGLAFLQYPSEQGLYCNTDNM